MSISEQNIKPKQTKDLEVKKTFLKNIKVAIENG